MAKADGHLSVIYASLVGKKEVTIKDDERCKKYEDDRGKIFPYSEYPFRYHCHLPVKP